MKRDMDLCREILRQVEAHERTWEAYLPTISGRSEEEVSYHVRLLGQAGLLEVHHREKIGIADYAIALTWAGCEFMEATRDDQKWKEVKAKTLKGTGTLAFEAVKSVISVMTEAGVKALMS